MSAEVARGFEPSLNGGNPGRQARTGRTSIVLLAAVTLLAVLSPLVLAVSSASADLTGYPNPIITVTTTWDDGAMGGEPIGFTATGFPPNTLSPYQIYDDYTTGSPPNSCAGTLATDASGDATINDACSIGLGLADEDVNVTYDGFTVVQPAPPQPPAPVTPTVTTATVNPSTTNFGGSVTYSAEVSPTEYTGFTPTGTVAFTDGSTPLCTTAALSSSREGNLMHRWGLTRLLPLTLASRGRSSPQEDPLAPRR
jgi:hypothetical protein